MRRDFAERDEDLFAAAIGSGKKALDLTISNAKRLLQDFRSHSTVGGFDLEPTALITRGKLPQAV